MLSKVLAEVRRLKREALKAKASDYKKGYMNALDDVEEYVEDVMWSVGEDDDV